MIQENRSIKDPEWILAELVKQFENELHELNFHRKRHST
jgi:hypothetical protein